MGAVRLVVFGFVFLSIVYWLVSIYSRSVRRERLENSWSADHPNDDDSDARRTFIDEGMADYQTGLRRKLILLVYIIPVLLVIAALFFTNAN